MLKNILLAAVPVTALVISLYLLGKKVDEIEELFEDDGR